jgi:hypothetical protein
MNTKHYGTSRDLLKADNTELTAAAGQGILKAIRDHNATHPRT